MRNALIVGATLLVASIGLAGCKSDEPMTKSDKPMMKSDASTSSKMPEKMGMMTVATASPDADVMKTAPMDGPYMLMSSEKGTVMQTVTLKKGDPIGFLAFPDGTMQAMAGGRTYNVKGKTAVWVHGM